MNKFIIAISLILFSCSNAGDKNNKRQVSGTDSGIKISSIKDSSSWMISFDILDPRTDTAYPQFTRLDYREFDSTGTVNNYLYVKGYTVTKGSIVIGKDSMLAIARLVSAFVDNEDMARRNNEIQWAAEDILNYVKMDGGAIDPKDKQKFDSAVTKYLNLKNKK